MKNRYSLPDKYPASSEKRLWKCYQGKGLQPDETIQSLWKVVSLIGTSDYKPQKLILSTEQVAAVIVPSLDKKTKVVPYALVSNKTMASTITLQASDFDHIPCQQFTKEDDAGIVKVLRKKGVAKATKEVYSIEH